MLHTWGPLQQFIALWASSESHSKFNISGYIIFTQYSKTNCVIVDVKLSGLPCAKLGFHVHEKSIPTNVKKFDCKLLGGHFNPYNVNHGSYKFNTVRHVGDLINNLEVDSNGNVNVNFVDNLISLYLGDNCIIDRSIVINVGTDDEGLVGLFSLQNGKKLNNKELESLKTGNVGNRIACGNIKLITNLK